VRTLVAKNNLPRLFIVEAEYRHMLREAELKWTRALIADIASGTLEGIDRWQRWHDELARPAN
jgi:hypothetical protein